MNNEQVGGLFDTKIGDSHAVQSVSTPSLRHFQIIVDDGVPRCTIGTTEINKSCKIYIVDTDATTMCDTINNSIADKYTKAVENEKNKIPKLDTIDIRRMNDIFKTIKNNVNKINEKNTPSENTKEIINFNFFQINPSMKEIKHLVKEYDEIVQDYDKLIKTLSKSNILDEDFNTPFKDKLVYISAKQTSSTAKKAKSFTKNILHGKFGTKPRSDVYLKGKIDSITKKKGKLSIVESWYITVNVELPGIDSMTPITIKLSDLCIIHETYKAVIDEAMQLETKLSAPQQPASGDANATDATATDETVGADNDLNDK